MTDVQDVPTTVTTPVTLVRPRLVALLDEAAHHRLVVMTAPAGSGKTVLLNQWTATRTGTVRVTLDARHRDPSRLWDHIGTALHGRPGVSRPEAVAVPGEPMTLVLDGFDRIGDDVGAASLAALLDSEWPRLRLVVASRTGPPLPSDRLRDTGELACLGPADLALTAAEAEELWAMLGRRPDDPAEVLTRTAGWAAGVALAGQPGSDALADLVRTMVLDPLDPGLRMWLTRLSVLDRVRPDLARALADGPWWSVALRTALLVADGQAPHWFRLWRPVAETLRESLAGDPEFGLAHRRAAKWFAEHDDPLRAAGHAIEAGDQHSAIDLIVRHAVPPLVAGSVALSDLIDRLSIVDALDDPELATVLAVGRSARGDEAGSRAYAALAAPLVATAPPVRRDALGALLDACALIGARQVEDLASFARTADALSGRLDATAPGAVPHVDVLGALIDEARGTLALWSGDRDDAARRLAAAATMAVQHDLAALAARARAGLAMLHCGQGWVGDAVASPLATVTSTSAGSAAGLSDLVVGSVEGALPDDGGTAALAHLVWAAEALASGAEDPGACLSAFVGPRADRPSRAAVAALLARVRLGEDEPDLAGARQALATIGEDRPPLLRDWIAIAEAELRLAEGRPVQALAVLGEVGHGRSDPLAAAARVRSARAYLAGAAPARAISLLAAVKAWPEVGPVIRAEAWVVEALAADVLGHPGAVTIALGEAIGLAGGPDGPIGPLRTPAARDLLQRHRDLLDATLAERLTLVPVPPTTLVEAVTPREGIVLRYLPTLLTIDEIARELSVSTNTVKTHLRHLYRKLAVTSRRAAVHEARRLGLLTGPALAIRAEARRSQADAPRALGV